MLQARSQTGDLITLVSLTPEEINDYRQTEAFHCPVCQEPVLIKAGKLVMPHFAHQAVVNCPSAGGEGIYHEQGKLLLYQWLTSQGLKVELEKYLPTLKQQPDLLVTLNQKKIALEYQCARVSIEEIQRRNQGYQKQGIQPIWILGEQRLKRYGPQKIHIDQFILQFLHQYAPDKPLTLYFFCPHTLTFILFQDLFMVHQRSAYGSLTIRRLNQMIFTDLFKQVHLEPTRIYQQWKKEKRRFRLHQRQVTFGKERAWQQYLYAKQTHREYLPSLIYLPVAHQFKMTTSLWDWQTRLCLEIIDPLPIGGQFTLQSCEKLLSRYIQGTTEFPLVYSPKKPIEEYLLLLKKLQYIEESGPNTYTKLIALHYYDHIEDAIQGDELLLNELIAVMA